MERIDTSLRGERGCYQNVAREVATRTGRGELRYYYHECVTVTVTAAALRVTIRSYLTMRQANFDDVEWRPSITLLPMPPRKSRKTTTKSKRKGKPRSSRQTTDNGNSRLHSTNSNTGLADQIVKAQALYGLGTVYTVHRDKSKVQRYSPPLAGNTGEV